MLQALRYLIYYSFQMKQVSRSQAAPGNGQLRLDLFLPYRLSALAARTSRLLSSVYEERFGITIPEWRVIAHVAAHDALSLREVSRLTHLDKATASRAVASLEAAGLLAKRTNPADRRLVELSLTRKGKRLFGKIEPLALGFETDLLQGLSAKEVTALRGLILQLDRRLEEMAAEDKIR